jgi:anti-sigma-K factor RskA
MADHVIPHPRPHPDMAGYVLGGLTPAEAQRFEGHLAGCVACRAEVAELEGLPGLLQAAAEEPPAELRGRTLAAVAAARVKASEARASPSTRGAVLDRIRAVWRRPVVVVATVVLVAVLGISTLAGRDTGRAPVTVPLAAVAGERGSGEATIRRSAEGLAIKLSVRGLAPNRPGTYYECWYVSERDSVQRPHRVSGGTFTVPEGGMAAVALTTAADYREYPGIAITLESNDGDPGTTGPVILESG